MKSCHQLSQAALDYRFNPRVPLKLYLKTCVSLLEEAQQSFQLGNVERSYIMYLRYLDLCMKKLPAHPQLFEEEANVDRGLAKKEYMQLLKLEVPAILKISEDLRIHLDRTFAQHTTTLAANVPKPRALKKDKVERTELPSNFDEARFKQSLSTLQRHDESAAPLRQRESHIVYPELPQLNQPFYASF
ncbi:LANO_0D10682g1_1 [Lachancea nothofagi CBS 11611]|uniref:Regulator of free ubiquitin chains 1 n=1 Tax=Lachancea nothofagi CBS 11611 TaxID=1266666 RepID=A0A1G4JKH8_9SACH|nr:LANO_0D10682g1_1 [Lachancea nothofagi CBS 11611]